METNVKTKRPAVQAEKAAPKEISSGKLPKKSAAPLQKPDEYSLPEWLLPALPPGAVRWYIAALLTVLLLCLAAGIHLLKQ